MANITTNYLYTGKGPFDAKMLVSTYADLYAEGTFPSGSAYNGMLVAVGLNKDDSSKNGVYYLYDATCTTKFKSPVTTLEANWHKLVNLSEFNSIKERIEALEAKGETPTGITEEELNAAIEALRTEITNAGYLTADDIANKADADHTHNIEDIEGYEPIDTSVFANAEDVNSQLQAIRNNVEAIKVPTKVGELDNDAGYITVSDLSGYAKADDVTNLRNEVVDNLGAIQSAVNGQATQISQLETKAANHDQEIAAIKPQVEKIAGIESSISTHEDTLNSLNTTIQGIQTEVSNKVSTETFESALNDKADKSALNDKADTSYVDEQLATKANKSDVDTALEEKASLEELNNLSDNLVNKVDVSSFNDLAEVVETKVDASFVEGAINDLKIETYAKKDEVTSAEQGAELYQKLANVYTKGEIDTKLAEISAGGDISLDGYVTEEALAQKGYITESEVNTKIEAIEIPDVSIYATKEEVEAIVIPDTSAFITMSDVEALGYLKEIPSDVITENELTSATAEFISEGEVDSKLASYATTEALSAKADQASVNEALEGKADSATTLSGYGITDAYTRTEVDVKLADLASGGSINLDGYVSEDEWNERVTTLATKEEVTAAVNGVKITYGEF